MGNSSFHTTFYRSEINNQSPSNAVDRPRFGLRPVTFGSLAFAPWSSSLCGLVTFKGGCSSSSRREARKRVNGKLAFSFLLFYRENRGLRLDFLFLLFVLFYFPSTPSGLIWVLFYPRSEREPFTVHTRHFDLLADKVGPGFEPATLFSQAWHVTNGPSMLFLLLGFLFSHKAKRSYFWAKLILKIVSLQHAGLLYECSICHLIIVIVSVNKNKIRAVKNALCLFSVLVFVLFDRWRQKGLLIRESWLIWRKYGKKELPSVNNSCLSFAFGKYG